MRIKFVGEPFLVKCGSSVWLSTSWIMDNSNILFKLKNPKKVINRITNKLKELNRL